MAGAAGAVGREVVRAVAAAGDLSLTGAVSRREAGRRVGEVVEGAASDLTFRATLAEALETPADVLIDYTEPAAAEAHASLAAGRGAHVVIGATGFDEAAFERLGELAGRHSVGIVVGHNFAITTALLEKCAAMIASYLPAYAVTDYASPHVRAPLGTSVGIRRSFAGGRAGEIPIHSIRAPGYASAVEVVFGDGDEQLTLRHSNNSVAAYVRGTLMAARAVPSVRGLRRGIAWMFEG